MKSYSEYKYITKGWSLSQHLHSTSFILKTPVGVKERDIKIKLRTLPGVKDFIVADVTLWKKAVGLQFFFNCDLPVKELLRAVAELFNLEINKKDKPKEG